MNPISCEQCGNSLSLENKFCPICGAAKTDVLEKIITCSNCKHVNPLTASFCEKCGTQLSKSNADPKSKEKEPVTFRSRGDYSGEMIKSKTSRGWKIFRNIIIAIVLFGVLALIIWFQTDPDAGKKLTDALMGIGFMAVFFFVGWLFMRGKKRRRGSNYDDDYYSDVSDNNDFDDDDD